VAARPRPADGTARGADTCRPVVIAADTAGGPLSGPEPAAAAPAAPCRRRRAAAAPGGPRDCGVSGRHVRCPAPTGRWCPPVLCRPGRLTSVGERRALLPACRSGLPQPTRGRPQRPLPVCGGQSVRGAVHCGLRRCPVRPTGRLPRCLVSATLTKRRPVSGRRCPPRTLPQPAGVRCYRNRSPGRHRLPGCSHRRCAWPTCLASRWRSYSRASSWPAAPTLGPPRPSARQGAGP
jgi:hypothetical protein